MYLPIFHEATDVLIIEPEFPAFCATELQGRQVRAYSTKVAVSVGAWLHAYGGGPADHGAQYFTVRDLASRPMLMIGS